MKQLSKDLLTNKNEEEKGERSKKRSGLSGRRVTFIEKQIENDLEHEHLKNKDHFNGKLYDIILSLGSFADFGELSVVLKLAEMNLNEDSFRFNHCDLVSTKDIVLFQLTRSYFNLKEYLRASNYLNEYKKPYKIS